MKLLFCHRRNIKTLMPLSVRRKVSNKTGESEGLFQVIQKNEKSALIFNSVIPSSKFSTHGCTVSICNKLS